MEEPAHPSTAASCPRGPPMSAAAIRSSSASRNRGQHTDAETWEFWCRAAEAPLAMGPAPTRWRAPVPVPVAPQDGPACHPNPAASRHAATGSVPSDTGSRLSAGDHAPQRRGQGPPGGHLSAPIPPRSRGRAGLFPPGCGEAHGCLSARERRRPPVISIGGRLLPMSRRPPATHPRGFRGRDKVLSHRGPAQPDHVERALIDRQPGRTSSARSTPRPFARTRNQHDHGFRGMLSMRHVPRQQPSTPARRRRRAAGGVAGFTVSPPASGDRARSCPCTPAGNGRAAAAPARPDPRTPGSLPACRSATA